MDHRDIPEQVLIEHEILALVMGGLRTTIGWKHQGADLSRKLESLRFVGQSFQRHLKRLLALEENDGYMSVVVASRPELNDEVQALRQEHDEFRKGLNRILTRLRVVQPTDHLTFAKISEELVALLEKLEKHNHKEAGLIEHALLQDEGGEG